jgi:scyllo-inosamine-4-phosphate amidinotransferase 1
MVLRPRLWESDAYKEILLDYLRSGARWLAAPKPRMADECYDLTDDGVGVLRDLEPMFDAANVLRMGRDILYLVSAGGNELGARWLESVLGPEYRVHRCRDLYAGTHIDSTIALLRPGLALLCPERVTELNMPEPLRKWDHVWCPPMADPGWLHAHPYTSVWIGMNVFMVNPDLAVVDRRQTDLIRELESRGIDVCPLSMPHVRSIGGGFHCAALDVRRSGQLEDYS